MIYSYNNSNNNNNNNNNFIKNSTCFGQIYCPTLKNFSMTNIYCCIYSVETPDDGQQTSPKHIISYHLFSFRGSVQDYKIHMDMEMVKFA